MKMKNNKKSKIIMKKLHRKKNEIRKNLKKNIIT